MKLTMGTLAVLSTLIASILIGGATFGDLRGAVRENTNSIEVYRNVAIESIREIRAEQREMLKVLIELQNDMKWIKHNLTERGD